MEELSISENEVTSLEPLRSCTGLQVLRLQYTPVTDISPLKDLPEFNSIYLDSQFDREKVREVLYRDGEWQFRNGDSMTKQFILDDIYGFDREE